MLSSDFHCNENYGFWVIPIHPGLVTMIMVVIKSGSRFVESCLSWVYGYNPEPIIFLCNENPVRALNPTSLKCCLPSTDTINRQEKIHVCIWRFKVTSCKCAFNHLFWSCFKIIVALQLHVHTTSARWKLNSYCSHCERAGSGEGELTYSKDRWVSKLPQQKKNILPS